MLHGTTDLERQSLLSSEDETWGERLTSWKQRIKKNCAFIAAVWAPQALVYTMSSFLFSPGGNDACLQGRQDMQNKTYDEPIFPGDGLLIGGSLSTAYGAPIAVLIANLFAFDGGKLVVQEGWWNKVKGATFLTTAASLAISGVVWDCYAQSWMHEGKIQSLYWAGATWDGYGHDPCQGAELPAEFFTVENVITAGIAIGSAAKAAKFGMFLGQQELQQRQALQNRHVQSELSDNLSNRL